MDGGFHPNRLLQLQKPGEIAETQPEPVRRVTGSNDEPLGARQNRRVYSEDSLPGQLGYTVLSASGPFDEPGHPTMRPQVPYNNLHSRGSTFQPHQRPLPDRSDRRFQCLFTSGDADLLNYLTHRHISVSFLHEIDQFLRNNPELYRYSREWADRFNSYRPLDAYKFFLKGYTKPARYVHGYLPDALSFSLPQAYIPSRLDLADDEELFHFFEGVPFRYDILQEIDRIVDGFCYQIQCGVFVKAADRRLVTYAIWGNPIDAYKYYEYNYQTTWLKHRYLPEHIELDKIPKGEDYSLPVASVIGSDEGHRSHRLTRQRMARAHDNGIDVLDVLIQDFVRELAHKGHRRNHIEKMKRKARDTLDEERNDPQGYDIVDLVMGMADSEPRLEKRVHHNPVIPSFTMQIADGEVVSYTMPPGGLFTMPGNVTFSGGFVNGNTRVKREPRTPQAQQRKDPRQRMAEAMEEHVQATLVKRKNAYRAARSRFIQMNKEESLKRNNGSSPEMQHAASRRRAMAARSFASSVISLNNKTKQLTPEDVERLRKLQACSLETQPPPDDILARFGNLLA